MSSTILESKMFYNEKCGYGLLFFCVRMQQIIVTGTEI
jgi:hypothetical protein